jgi:hypothetical protein
MLDLDGGGVVAGVTPQLYRVGERVRTWEEVNGQRRLHVYNNAVITAVHDDLTYDIDFTQQSGELTGQSAARVLPRA